MDIIDSLKGIKAPEERAVVEFSRNPLNYFKSSYQAWNSMAGYLQKDVRKITGLNNNELQVADNLYAEALRLIDNLKIDTKDAVSLLRENLSSSSFWGGLYLTALLNTGCLDELIIEEIYGLSFVGYKLKRGKIIINESVQFYTGEFANSCVIENNARLQTSMAHKATGGIFINNGHVLCLGHTVKGGVYINNGEIKNNMAAFSSSSVFFNKGIIDGYACPGASDIIFVNKGKIWRKEYRLGIFLEKRELDNSNIVKPIYPFIDQHLRNLVNALEDAAYCLDEPKTKEIKKEIEPYYKLKYGEGVISYL